MAAATWPCWCAHNLNLSRRRLSLTNTLYVSRLSNRGSTTPTHPSLPPSPPTADVFLRLDQRYQSVIADICQKMGAGMAEFVTDSAAESEVGARGGWCEGGGWCRVVVAGVGGGGCNFLVGAATADWVLRVL
jgi:hypothetical protein